MTVLHVATDGSDTAEGSEGRPFRTISRAAELARPGDTVVVHAGEYREWVRPRRGGLSDQRRITYEAAPGEHVVVKGSERVRGWEPEGGTVWRASVPNSLFGGYNPFALEVAGDWLVEPEAPARKHLGEVYLNGRSFYEVGGRDEVTGPPLRTEVVDHWTGVREPVRNPERPGSSGTPRSARRRPRSGPTSRGPTPTPSSSRSTCAARCSPPPSTTSTTSP